jgi:hypothetical protein
MNTRSPVRTGRTLAAAAVTCLAVGAAQATDVWLQAPAAVTAGDVFVVTMSGTSFEPIVGGGADLSFSAGLLELVSVSFDPMWSFITSPGEIDHTAGTVTGLYFNLFGEASGDFAIATLEFRALGEGLANFDAAASSDFPFGSILGVAVPVQFHGDSIAISPVPEPAAWWMLAGGLAVVAGARRLRRQAAGPVQD